MADNDPLKLDETDLNESIESILTTDNQEDSHLARTL